MNLDDAEAVDLSGILSFLIASLLPLAVGKYMRGTRQLLTRPEDSNQDEKDVIASGAANDRRKLVVLYGTVTGTAAEMATALYEDLLHIDSLDVSICNIKEFDEETLEKIDIAIFLCCTWSEGSPPEAAIPFMTWLVDLAQDFRVSKDKFEKISFSGFGLGSKVYGKKKFCKPVSVMHCSL